MSEREKLSGKRGTAGNNDRISFLTTLLDTVVTKENHIDGLRQRNITIALVIFAGLFGFGLKSTGTINAYFASSALTALMIVFCILDRRLHMFSHGFRDARKFLVGQLAGAINDPDQDVQFLTYRAESEQKAEWFSVQPVIHYSLAVGGVLSFFLFR